MIATNLARNERPAPPGYLTLADVQAAARTLAAVAHRTPVLTSRTLDRHTGARLSLKAETLQRVGAFKFRGAYHAMACLDPEQRRTGVVAASSGNHAQAVALAGALLGIPVSVLMPTDAPALKRAATEAYGAEVIDFDRYRDDREALLRALAAERAATIIHPYDDPRVMAGQGTVALELIEQAGDLDVLVVPVGGGGLISGCGTVIRALCPQAEIVGVEPEAGDDVARSLAGRARTSVAVAPTIADGQQTPAPGERTWPVIQALVDTVLTVSDAEILATMRTCAERLNIVVEPSGATALAAVLHGHIPIADRHVGIVLSGGNADPAILTQALATPGIGLSNPQPGVDLPRPRPMSRSRLC